MMYYGDKQKIAAFETLKKLGLFIPFGENRFWHGRTNTDGKPWQYNMRFVNGGNSTGNYNVDGVNGFYASTDRQIAFEFASARSEADGGTPEVHEIGCYDKDAVILDRRFDVRKLNDKEKTEFYSALAKLSEFSSLEASPVPFDKRHLVAGVKEKLAKAASEHFYITDKILDEIIAKDNLDEQTARNIMSSHNTKNFLAGYPINSMQCFLHGNRTVTFDTGETMEVNFETIAAWCDKNHVVGSLGDVSSGTLRKNVATYKLIDSARINSAEKVRQDKAETEKQYGGIAELYDKMHNRGGRGIGFYNYGTDAALSKNPKDIMRWACAVEGFENSFRDDAGNWEGFTVGEHTETVLRVFDETYRYRLPDAMYPVANLALLVHDIGKGEAVRRGDKQHQKQYNVGAAQKFMDKIGIDPRFAEIIKGIIGQGQVFTTDYFIRGDKSAMQGAKNYFSDLLTQQGFGVNEIDGITDGIMGVSKIVQTCDSAAYTDMAITVRDNEAFYNSPSFNNSFERGAGLRGNFAEWKHSTELPNK